MHTSSNERGNAPGVLLFSADLTRINTFRSTTVAAFPLSAMPEQSVLNDGLAAVVVSFNDKGFGSIDELAALGVIQAAGVPAKAFIMAEGLDDGDLTAIVSYSRSTLQKQQLAVEIIAGTRDDLNTLISSLVDDSTLLEQFQLRQRLALESAKLQMIASAEAATRADLAQHFNVRINCQRLIDQGMELERAIDRAFSEALQRLNESEVHARLIRELKAGLDKLKETAEWPTRSPNIISVILSTWQVERVNNFLLDIKRFAEVDISFSSFESPTGINIVAEVRPVGPKETLDRTLRVGGTAVLTKVAIATFVPIFAPVAIPIAIGTAVFAWLQWGKDGQAGLRDRFVAEINVELIAEVRNATLAVVATLKATADAAKSSVRDSVRERLRDLLASNSVMSDAEASKRVNELQKLKAL